MSEPVICFYFDYLSPYAYLAWSQIHALAERTGHQVAPIPTLLAALLAKGGTRGPAEIPAKRAYLFKDTLRSARVLGLPLEPPPSHPFNPLLALRVSSLDLSADEQRRVIDALFRAAWGGGGGVESPEAAAHALGAAGFDGPALIARAAALEIKERLRKNTEDAIAAGVFGVPTMRVGDEIFWGYDSFGHLERFLRGEASLPAEALERWRLLPASARRRET